MLSGVSDNMLKENVLESVNAFISWPDIFDGRSEIVI